MEKSKVDRINELARISKERALTPAELEEQKTLRAEYITEFKKTLRGQ